MGLTLKNPLVRAWGWTVFIVVLLSVPGGIAPVSTLFQADKLVHFSLFLILALLWLRTPWNRGSLWTWSIIGAGIAFSILSELYQGILPIDRSPDFYDVLADIVGVAVGAVIWHVRKSRSRSGKE